MKEFSIFQVESRSGLNYYTVITTVLDDYGFVVDSDRWDCYNLKDAEYTKFYLECGEICKAQ